MLKPKEVIHLFEALTKDDPDLLKEEGLSEGDVLLLKLSHHVTKYWDKRGEKEPVSDSPVLGKIPPFPSVMTNPAPNFQTRTICR